MSLVFGESGLSAFGLIERAYVLNEIETRVKHIWGEEAVEDALGTLESLSKRYGGKLPRAYLSGPMPSHERALLKYLAFAKAASGTELQEIVAELKHLEGVSQRPLRARFPVGSVLHRVSWRRSARYLRRGYKPLEAKTNAGFKSVHESEVLYGLANSYLELVENGKASDSTASDLRKVMKRVVDVSDELGGKRDSLDAYADDFVRRRVKENELKFAAEAFFRELDGNPVQAQNLAWNFAELANMLYVAKDIARRNFLDTQSGPVKGDLLHYLLSGEFASVGEAIAYMNKVEFRPVLTAHPTNVNRGAYLQLMLQFGAVALGITRNDLGVARRAEASEARKNYWQLLNRIYESPIVPSQKFKPLDEMDIENAALNDICANMACLRQAFDEALETAALRTGQAYTAEDRLRLHLNIKLLSWVMGDKDGNDNIKAEHLLRNVVAHRLAIARQYVKDLRELQAKGIQLDLGPVKRPWLAIFEDAESRLAEIQGLIKSDDRMDIPLSKSEFNQLMGAMAFAYPLQEEEVVRRFSKVLEDAYRSYPDGVEEQTALISIIDKVRSFGVSFASIELRETSSKYTEALDFLFRKGGLLQEGQSYVTMPEAEKIAFLEAVYADPERLASPIREFLEGIDDTKPRAKNGVNLRDYANTEALVYHTLKRLELAAGHPDAVQDLVLAEFKEPSKLLEVVALQKAIGRVAEYEPSMTVVPLFEEFNSLEGAPDMLLAALNTRAFRQHLLALAKGDPSKIVLPIQIAHSDNNRLSGMPAARAGIAEVHRKVPLVLREHFEEIRAAFVEDEKAKGNSDAEAMFRDMAISFEFFEGRSHSDAWRGGHRFSGALSNLLNTHECVWETFQGIDVYAYLQIPETFKRTVMHTICSNAARLAKRDRLGGVEAGASRTPSVEDVVIEALKRTAPDYAETHFNNAAGELFGHPLVNKNLNGVLTNIGSRSVSRGGVEVVPTAAGEAFVDHTKMRAIPFGNNYLEAGVHPAILGAANIEKYFAETFAKNAQARADLEAKAEGFGFEKGSVFAADGSLTPVGLQTLFKISPVFRDVVHFLVTGVSMTTIEQTQERFRKAEKSGVPYSDTLKAYLTKTVPLEVGAASKLVLGAYGYALTPALEAAMAEGKVPSGADCSRLSFLVRNVTGIGPEMALTRNSRIVTQVGRDWIVQKAYRRADKAFTAAEMWMLKMFASAELCARHRSPTISDDNDMWAAKKADRSTTRKKEPCPRANEQALQVDEVDEEAPAGTVCVRNDKVRVGGGVRGVVL